MGRIFLEHLGGLKLFNCAKCHTNLTNRSQLISKHFRKRTGRAYLFKRVVNLTFSPIQERVMLTGHHMVRDVMCKNCATKLGWMYEFATEETQKYKEGCVVLEYVLIKKAKGFPSEAGGPSH